MKALRLNAWKSDPVLEDVSVPEPSPGEVLVQVGGAGACHSDLHLMHEFEAGMLPWSPPFTLGHENAGWVHTLGSGVTGFEPGQPVAVVGAWGCGSCAHCRAGLETYCERPDLAPVPGGGSGLGLDGGMADYLLVPSARHLVALPDGLDPVQAAPLTDAGLTPYHAVRRSLPKLLPGSTALVVGGGGLGHLGVQVLKALTAARVIVVDPRSSARDLALGSGADAATGAGPGHRRGGARSHPRRRRRRGARLRPGPTRPSRLGHSRSARSATSRSSGSVAAPCRCRSSASPTSAACRRRTGATAPSWSRSSTSARAGSSRRTSRRSRSPRHPTCTSGWPAGRSTAEPSSSPRPAYQA